MATFRSIYWDFCIFRFSYFVQWRLFKKWSRIILSVLGKRNGLKDMHQTQIRNSPFDFCLTRDLISFMPYGIRNLLMLIRRIPDIIHFELLTYFRLVWLQRMTKPAWQIVKDFDFDLTCDVFGDIEVSSLVLPSTNFSGLSNTVRMWHICPAVPETWERRGRK